MVKRQWLFISSCVHLGESACRVDLFRQSLDVARRLRAHICLIGDTLDVGTYTGTAHTGSVWENDLTPQEQVDLAVKLLKPYRSQIKVVLTGNHESRVHKAAGLHLNKIVADAIGCGAAYKDTHYTLPVLGRRIFMGHGASRRDFSQVLSGHEAVDAVVLGHTHELESSIRVRRNGSGGRRVLLVRAGTYLQEPRYGKLALYPPNPLGAAWLSVQREGPMFCDLGITPRLP